MPRGLRIAAATALGVAGTIAVALSVVPAPTADAHAAGAPARKCKPMVFDVRQGTLNGLGPMTSAATVKKRLPCFTGESAEGELYNYGGGVFFNDQRVYFYTYLRFIEVRAQFNGTTQPAVFGRTRTALASEFDFLPRGGRPSWGGAQDEFVTSKSGCIQLIFGKEGKVDRIRSYTRGCGVLFQPR